MPEPVRLRSRAIKLTNQAAGRQLETASLPSDELACSPAC